MVDTQTNKTRICITGAAGRMGQALIRAIDANENLVLSAALEHTASPALGEDASQLAGIKPSNIKIQSDIAAALSQSDAIIDFTVPENTLQLAKLAASRNKIHIIGTTGFSTEQEDELKTASQSTIIVKSGNMSLGVNLLAALVEQTAQKLGEEFDIEILEMHHRHKIDAPSGTALLLGEAAAIGRNISLQENNVMTRQGQTDERPQGSIGFATLRGGSVVGDHDAIFAGDAERIILSHRAENREIFANGALRAVLWALDKPAGFYSMRDVLGL